MVARVTLSTFLDVKICFQKLAPDLSLLNFSCQIISGTSPTGPHQDITKFNFTVL